MTVFNDFKRAFAYITDRFVDSKKSTNNSVKLFAFVMLSFGATTHFAKAQCGFTISPTSDATGCLQVKEEVVWTGLTNTSLNGGFLSKQVSDNNWNAGALSTAWVYDFGQMHTVIGETNTERAIGLSHSGNSTNVSGIQFAFRLQNNGSMEIRESGANRGNVGAYQVGDTLRIAVENNVVTYFRNGDVLYVSNLSPTLPLRVDAAFRTTGGTLQNVEIVNYSNTAFFAHTQTNVSGLNPTYQWAVNGSTAGSNTSTFNAPSIANGDVVTCTLTTSSGCASGSAASNEIEVSVSEAFAPGNFYIAGNAATAGCQTANEQVQWDVNTLSNISVQNNDLVKLQGGNNWNARAASSNTVHNNGRFNFSTDQNQREKAIGLSANNQGDHFSSIDFCFLLAGNAQIRIFESGSNRGSFGNYDEGDSFSIGIVNNVVHYYHNGEVLYISNQSPSLPLLAKATLRNEGATLSDAEIVNLNEGVFIAFAENAGPNPTYQWKLNGSNTGSNSNTYSNPNLEPGDMLHCVMSPDLASCEGVNFSSNHISKVAQPQAEILNFYISAEIAPSACYQTTEEVQWNSNSLQNVAATGSDLLKLQGGNDWNGNAFSSNAVGENGALSFSTLENNRQKAIGLSSADGNEHFSSIDFCFFLEGNGNLRIYESGSDRGNFGTYSAGDSLSIVADNGEIKYFINATLLRISTVQANFPLHADVSMRNEGSTVTYGRITNFNAGVFHAYADLGGATPHYQWQINGSDVGSNDSTYTNDALQEGDVLTCILSPAIGGCGALSYTSNAIVQNAVEAPSTINFYISADAAEAACYRAVEEVQWNASSLLHVKAEGSNLVKIQSGNNWNGNASSHNRVYNDGAFSFSTSENNRAKAIGLSHTDSGNDRNSIQYCFLMEGNGNLRIYESGADRGNVGAYTIGDSLSIAVEGGVVKYYRNGNLLRISTVEPNLPLIADASLYATQSRITKARISNLSNAAFTANFDNAGDNPVFQWKVNNVDVGSNSAIYVHEAFTNGDVITCEITPELGGCGSLAYTSNSIVINAIESPSAINFFITGTVAEASCHNASEEVRWNSASLLHTDATGSDLVKVQSGNNWNGNAASLNRVYNDGAFSFSTAESNRAKAVGLSHTDVNDSRYSIQYCFFLESNGNLRIYESGADRGNFGGYTPGDSLSIAVDNEVVKYYRNGNLLRISTVAPTLPLLADASLYSVNSTITQAKITNLNGSVFTAHADNAGDEPSYQWMVNGSPSGSNASTFSADNLGDGDIVTCVLNPDLNGCGNLSYTSNAIVKNAEIEPAAINFFIAGTPSSSACHVANEEVQWDIASLLHVERSGNNLVKIQSGNNWNGNASSLNTVVNNGSFSFSAAETNRAKAAGLSHADVNSSIYSIQFAFYLESNGNLRIYEQGNNIGNFGGYTTNDVLRIAVENGVVKYYRNAQLLYISTVTPQLPLIADVSLYSMSSTITNASISNPNGGTFTAQVQNAGDAPQYQWQLNGSNVGDGTASYTNDNVNDDDVITCLLIPDLSGCDEVSYTSNSIEIEILPATNVLNSFAQGVVNQEGFGYAIEDVVWDPETITLLQADGNSLAKVQSNGQWNAGAASLNSVKNNGYMECTVTETNRRRMVGLSPGHVSPHFANIRYAMYLDAGALRIYENGAHRGSFGGLSTGDVLRIAVEESVVKYYRNGNLVYTSNVSPSLPLVADVSVRDIGATVSNVVIANVSNGSFSVEVAGAGSDPSYQWQRNGMNVGSDAPSYSNPNLFDGDVITCIITPDLAGCSNAAFVSNEIVIEGPGAVSDWLGTVNNEWDLEANWSNGIPDQFQSARIPQGAANWPSVNALSQVNDLYIETGANLNFAGSNTLQVYGDIQNEGVINSGEGTIVAAGANSRSYSGNTISFNRFITNLSNASDSIIMQTDMRIGDEALLLSGVIYTENNEVVYMPGAESRFGSANSYVDGACRKIGNDAFIFPLGKAGIYAPAGISAPADPLSEFRASYHNVDPNEEGYNTSLKDFAISGVSRCEYWMIDREVGTSAVSVSLSYENERSCGVNDPSQLRVMRWNGDMWQDHGYLSHEGTASAGVINSGAAIENFSPFTIGSSSPINPLPIELLSFAAKAHNKQVDLKWSTAAEINNDFFTIERSRDGVEFETVAIVQGAGNANHQIDYASVDQYPFNGVSYYRLKQTDFDGTSKTYPMQSVEIDAPMIVQLYPNPCRGQLNIEFTEFEHTAQVRVLNLSGQVVHSSQMNTSRIQLDLSALAGGVYLVQVEHREQLTTHKLVLEK